MAELPFDWDEATSLIADQDPAMGRVIKAVGPARLEPRCLPTPFHSLARAIVFQQLSGKAAATIFGRVAALFPRKRPTPDALIALPDEALRGCGVSGQKLAALRDLAAKTQQGVVPGWSQLRKLEDEQIIERLTQVRGVGRWTVEMLLMFDLNRPDVLPVADLGVRKGFQKALGLRKEATPEKLAKHAQRWRPYRTVASWYCWRALELPKDW